MVVIKWNYKKMIKNVIALILKIILLFSFLVLISECENIKILIYSKIISIIILFISSKILKKIS